MDEASYIFSGPVIKRSTYRRRSQLVTNRDEPVAGLQDSAVSPSLYWYLDKRNASTHRRASMANVCHLTTRGQNFRKYDLPLLVACVYPPFTVDGAYCGSGCRLLQYSGAYYWVCYCAPLVYTSHIVQDLASY
jgi:hypothetical protein